MPLYLWKDRNFSLVILILSLASMAFAPAVFFLAVYMQDIEHLPALVITGQLSPAVIIARLIMNFICGLILHRVPHRGLMGVSEVALLACFLTLSFMKEEASYWAFIFPSLILLAVGLDIQYNVTNLYVMASLSPNQQSVAGRILNNFLLTSAWALPHTSTSRWRKTQTVIHPPSDRIWLFTGGEGGLWAPQRYLRLS
ncbi:hypothetical protein BO71DRAFT_230673 [Aspergillus ellipticus CBS 707.79]|uniref:MFS general substrate transporter n=1 Tax=Aspergillus ellipticus CBS 707.79 TaxID=1448320 RepID=A0A319ETE7_9EURO|nr:hypothetical protein BO71DRAFT_230673 [Aspergillus ellipticus CBS 707.79]